MRIHYPTQMLRSSSHKIDGNFQIANNSITDSTTGFELVSINADSIIKGNRINNPEIGIKLSGQASHNFFLESNQIFNSRIAVDVFNLNGYFFFHNNTVYASDNAVQFNGLNGNARLTENFINSTEKAIEVVGTFSDNFFLQQNEIVAKYGLYFQNQVLGSIIFASMNSLTVSETGIYINSLSQGELEIDNLQIVQAKVAITVTDSNDATIEIRNSSLNSTEYAYWMQTAENSLLVFETTNFTSPTYIFGITNTEASFNNSFFSAEGINLQFVTISATSSVKVYSNTFDSSAENLYVFTLSGKLLVEANSFLSSGSTALQFDFVAGELELLSNIGANLNSQVNVKDSSGATIEITGNAFNGTGLSVKLRSSTSLTVVNNFLDLVDFTIQTVNYICL